MGACRKCSPLDIKPQTSRDSRWNHARRWKSGECNRPGRPAFSRMEEFQGGDPMRWRLLLILSLSGLLVASASASVEASYPGTNDGRLAFGMIVGGNADIYSVLPNGNDLRRLTTDSSFDACASYSPDGKDIAFCSTRSGVSEI